MAEEQLEPLGKSSAVGTSQVWLWSHLMWGEMSGVPRGTGSSTGGNRPLGLALRLGVGECQGHSQPWDHPSHPAPTVYPKPPRLLWQGGVATVRKLWGGWPRARGAITCPAGHCSQAAVGGGPGTPVGRAGLVDTPCQVEPAHIAEEELQVVIVALLHQGDDGAAGLEASL